MMSHVDNAKQENTPALPQSVVTPIKTEEAISIMKRYSGESDTYMSHTEKCAENVNVDFYLFPITDLHSPSNQHPDYLISIICHPEGNAWCLDSIAIAENSPNSRSLSFVMSGSRHHPSTNGMLFLESEGKTLQMKETINTLLKPIEKLSLTDSQELLSFAVCEAFLELLELKDWQSWKELRLPVQKASTILASQILSGGTSLENFEVAHLRKAARGYLVDLLPQHNQ